MKTILYFSQCFAMIVFASAAMAYEVETHEAITRKAYQESELFKNQGQVLKDAGIVFSASFQSSQGKLKSLEDLIAFGSIYEDTATACKSNKLQILGNRAGGCFRVFNHFYDPTRQESDRALNALLGLISQGNTYTVIGDILDPNGLTPVKSFQSPDWALEDKSIIDGTKWYENGQEFSWRDARAMYYKALTDPDPTVRANSFGQTFQTLGHVVHHIQDMFQPQHTRNDQHNGLFQGRYAQPWVHGSLFEEFTNNSDVRTNLSYTSPAGLWKAAFISTDPAPQFTTPRSFWDSIKEPGKTIGATYSNKNFFTAGKNQDANYPTSGNNTLPQLPSIVKTQFIDEQLDTVCNNFPNNNIIFGSCSSRIRLSLVHGTDYMRFYNTTVANGRLASSTDNKYATTWSIFDADLAGTVGDVGESEIYTYNLMNMKSALDFLIPEATAYSTGLINFFFRGKIDVVEAATSTPTNKLYTIKNLGSEAISGTFALYYDDPQDKRHLVTSWDLPTILAGTSSEITFFRPSINPEPNSYTLVFKGSMGEETTDMSGGGVVAKEVLFNTNDVNDVIVKSQDPNGPFGLPFTRFDLKVSVNNSGKIAFSGYNSANSSAGYVGLAPELNSTFTFEGTTKRQFSGAGINNASPPEAAFRELVTGSPPTYIVRKWKSPTNFTMIGRSSGVAGGMCQSGVRAGQVCLTSNPDCPDFTLNGIPITYGICSFGPSAPFDSAISFLDINDSGLVAFMALTNGSTQEAIFAGTNETDLTNISNNLTFGIRLRPQIANTNETVFNDGSGNIKVASPAYLSPLNAVSNTDFTTTADRPGISADGQFVATADTSTSNPGLMLTRWSNNKKSWVITDTKGNPATENGQFNQFSLSQRYAVSVKDYVISPTKIGKAVRLVFAATRTYTPAGAIAPLAPREGIFLVDVTIDDQDVLTVLAPPKLIAEVGEKYADFTGITDAIWDPAGKTIASFDLWDPLSDNGTYVGFWASFNDGTSAILRSRH